MIDVSLSKYGTLAEKKLKVIRILPLPAPCQNFGS